MGVKGVLVYFYLAAASEQPVLHVSVISWGLDTGRLDSLDCYITLQGHIEPIFTACTHMSKTHTHTCTHTQTHTHLLLSHRYVRELQKPTHLQTENKNTLPMFQPSGGGVQILTISANAIYLHFLEKRLAYTKCAQR